MVGVVVVDTQVGSDSPGTIILILGIEILQSDTATEAVTDVVAIAEAESNVAGTESARFGAIDSRALDVTVTEVLYTHSKCTMLAYALAITQSGEIGPPMYLI